MSSGSRPRVLIIGAGIVGCSVAGHLAGRGSAVVLIDAHRNPNRAASRWSYAWFNANQKEPDWYHQLNVRGMDEYPRLAQILGDSAWYFPVGHLMWSDETSPLSPGGPSCPVDSRHLEQLTQLGYAFQRLSADDVTRLEPGIAPAAIPDEALLFPAEGWIDTGRLTACLLRWGNRAGSIAYVGGTSITRFESVGHKIHSVVTASGERLRGDVIIVCAGANTAPILRTTGVELSIAARPAVAAVTKATTARLHRVLHAGQMSIRPHPGRRLMLHRNVGDNAIEDGPVSREVPSIAIDRLVDGARACLTADDLELEQVAFVDMPMPADGHPAIGWLPPWTNLYVAATHSGATIGPLLGRLVAEHVASGAADAVLEACDPRRLIVTAATVGVDP